MSRRAAMRCVRSFSIAVRSSARSFSRAPRAPRQHVVQGAELGADLLLQILFLAHELRERRVARDRARARCRQCLLDGAAADQLAELEALHADVGDAAAISGQQHQIGFDDDLHAIVGRRRDRRVVRVIARGGEQDRQGLADRPRTRRRRAWQRSARRRGWRLPSRCRHACRRRAWSPDRRVGGRARFPARSSSRQ